jgi:hypothetical protein
LFSGATLGAIEADAYDYHWLHLVGKGGKAGKVVVPPLACAALGSYLAQRGIPSTPGHPSCIGNVGNFSGPDAVFGRSTKEERLNPLI